MGTSEGFRVRVRSAKSSADAYDIAAAKFIPDGPEAALHPDELTAVYDTIEGVHRIQGVIEVEADDGGCIVTYGMAVDFGGMVGRFGFIRRRMAAMMRRGIAEDLVAELDGEWIDGRS